MATAKSIVDEWPPGALAAEQAESVIALIPSDEAQRPENREWLSVEIDSARYEFWALNQVRLTRWNTRSERKRATQQLNAMADAADAFLKAVRELEPFAKLRITRNPERVIPNVNRAGLPEWLRDPRFPADSIGKAANALEWIPKTARDEVKEIEKMSFKGGRPEQVPDHVLARRLNQLWRYLQCEIKQNNRESRDWPFLDFVQAVGRTILPDFSGEAAARAVLKANTDFDRKFAKADPHSEQTQ